MTTRHRGAPGFMPERMAEARRTCRLTQDQLAEKLGVSRASIIALERVGDDELTRSPSPRVLKEMAAALGVQPLWLLSATTQPTLVQLRFAAGLRVVDVASALSVTDTTVSQIERALSPLSPQRSESLGRLYGVPASDVLAAYELASANRAVRRTAMKEGKTR